MKDMKNRYILALCAVAVCWGMQSCDDEKYDVEGNSANLFYFKQSPAPEDKPLNSVQYNIVRTPVGGSGDELLVKIPVHSTRPVASDASISAGVDNALVAEYNSANGTDYKTFPEGTVNVVKSSVNFRQGSFVSYDSLEISVAKEHYEKFTESAYLLPIRLTEANQGKLSVTNGVLLAFVNSEYKLIRDNAGVGDISGTLVTDYTGWTISSADEPTLNYANCLDGSQTTGVNFANVERPSIVLDMQSVRNLAGIRLMPYASTSSYYELSSVGVEVSLDQSEWTSIGTATSMVKDGFYQLVVLYGSAEARYVRLNLVWRSGSGSWGYFYRNLREVGVYVEE